VEFEDEPMVELANCMLVVEPAQPSKPKLAPNLLPPSNERYAHPNQFVNVTHGPSHGLRPKGSCFPQFTLERKSLTIYPTWWL
jgi:hypothetical protein